MIIIFNFLFIDYNEFCFDIIVLFHPILIHLIRDSFPIHHKTIFRTTCLFRSPYSFLPYHNRRHFSHFLEQILFIISSCLPCGHFNLVITECSRNSLYDLTFHQKWIDQRYGRDRFVGFFQQYQ
jgi:hypothetical protein